jgi:hypothetical protein
VREATDFISGRSHLVKQELEGEMEKASAELAFETAAHYRDRIAELFADREPELADPCALLTCRRPAGETEFPRGPHWPARGSRNRD